MKKQILLCLFVISMFVISGCSKTTQGGQSSTQGQINTDEQIQLSTLLQKVETMIYDQKNYTLSTSVVLRYYEESDLNYFEKWAILTEKFNLVNESYEYGYSLKKVSIEDGLEAYRIVDNRRVSFLIEGGTSRVKEVSPYGRDFSNDALMNLSIWSDNLSQMTVTKDNQGRFIVQQRLSQVTDDLKQSKIIELGLTKNALNTTFKFIVDYNEETNKLTIKVEDSRINLSNESYAKLEYVMVFSDFGKTEMDSSVADYTGKVGSGVDSVLFYSEMDSLFTTSNINFNFYRIRVNTPSIYRVEWLSGHEKPHISFISSFSSPIQKHVWMDDKAIFFEPGDYNIIVKDSFRLNKEDYSNTSYSQVNENQTFTFQPQGQYDFKKLTIHIDPFKTRTYVKIKLSENGHLYYSLENKDQNRVIQDESGYYYTNGEILYLMSDDGNPVTVEVSYVDVYEKDQAPTITTNYSDIFYTNNRFREGITYQVLKITQAGDYMVSANYLQKHPKANLILTDQYGTKLFERDNHSIVHLEQGLYYVYLNSDDACFYQMKYTNMSE